MVTAWFPLYLVLLAAATLSPLAVGCLAQPLRLTPAPLDFVLNVVGFLPFGVGLARARRPVGQVIAIAAAMSATIEWIQQWTFRTPSLWDVVANVLGTAAGWLLVSLIAAHLIEPLRVIAAPLASAVRNAPLRAVAAFFAAFAMLALAAVIQPALRDRSHGFSNWVPEPFVLGPEEAGEAPWQGTLRELAVFDRNVNTDAVMALLDRSWSDGGPVLRMSFEGHAVARIDGPDGGAGVPLAPPRWIEIGSEGLVGPVDPWPLPDRIATHVFERVRTTNRIAIVARIRAHGFPYPTARLVSLSNGYQNRDFSIHFSGRTARFLMRTPIIGPNGTLPHRASLVSAAPLPDREITLVASGDRYRARLEWDGACRGEVFLPVVGLSQRIGTYLTLSVAICSALAALAAGTLLLGSSAGARAIAAIAAGAFAWAMLALAGAFDNMPPAGLWRHAVPALAASVATLPIVGALRLRRSGERLPSRPIA
ncbi:MAG: VanZ family protein [Gemmatimonadaceae bacterium]